MAAKKRLYYLIYKPYNVLSQFSDDGDNKGLGSIYKLPRDVYPLGRLDLDSEGLLILTNDRTMNYQLLNPQFEHERTYWAQVEGKPDQSSFDKLMSGVTINIRGKKFLTRTADIRRIDHPEEIMERDPQVNYLKHPVTSWLEIILTEGKNRQVRKMTAAVGHPTLRLIRIAIGELRLFPLKPGEITQITEKAMKKKLKL